MKTGASYRYGRGIIFILPCIVALYGIFSIAFMPTVSIYNGFGVDGIEYGKLAIDFDQKLMNGEISSYNILRIFPAAMVWAGMKVMHVTPTVERTLNNGEFPLSPEVLKGFQIYTLIILVLGAWLFALGMRALRFSDRKMAIASIGVFANFMFAREFFLEPAMTDSTAFAVGTAFAYGYFARKYWVLAVAFLIGALSWPPVMFMAPILMMFPFGRGMIPYLGKRMIAIGSIASGCCLAALMTYMVYFADIPNYSTAVMPIKWLAPLTIALSVVAWLLPLGVLMSKIHSGEPYKFKENFPFILLTGLLAGVVIGFKLAWGNGKGLYMQEDGSDFNFLTHVLVLLRYQATRPLGAFVSHFMFMGPLILVGIVLWKDWLAKAKGGGLGLTMFTLISLFFLMDSESRRMIFQFPIFALLIVWGMKEEHAQRLHVLTWLIICAIVSHVYLSINPLPDDIPMGVGHEMSYPLQKFFMNLGPWMSHTTYVVALAAFLLCGALLIRIFKLKLKDLLPPWMGKSKQG